MKNLFNKNLIYKTSTVSDRNMSFNWGEREDVLRNRKKFLEKNSIPLNKCVGISLLHGVNIVKVSSKDAGELAINTVEGDALITNENRTFLFMLTGDCLPIVVYDPQKSVLALLHCGWKSTEEKLAEKVVDYFLKNGSSSENIFVTIGPGIHKESYIHKELTADKNKWCGYIKELKTGQFKIDIVGFNLLQLMQKGIPLKNIEVSPVDTAKDEKYFSHYRSKRTGEKEGRFCTVVGMID